MKEKERLDKLVKDINELAMNYMVVLTDNEYKTLKNASLIIKKRILTEE